MTARSVILGLNALMFIVFGLGFIFAPAAVTPMFLGVAAPDGDLLVDMRATYGGLSLAVGLYMAFCTLCRPHLYLGLMLSLLIYGALLVARGIAILAEASVGQAMYQSLVLELVMTILFAAIYLTGRRRPA